MAVVNVLRIPAVAARGPRGSWLARARARGDADRWLRVSEGRSEAHPAFAWRTAELTSPRERRLLARSLRGVVADVRAPVSAFSAAPLNRRGLRPYAEEIEKLATRVGDFEQPVTAAGIVLTRDLLADDASPLDTGGQVSDLPATLARISSILAAGSLDASSSCQAQSPASGYPDAQFPASADDGVPATCDLCSPKEPRDV